MPEVEQIVHSVKKNWREKSFYFTGLHNTKIYSVRRKVVMQLYDYKENNDRSNKYKLRKWKFYYNWPDRHHHNSCQGKKSVSEKCTYYVQRGHNRSFTFVRLENFFE